MKLSFFTLSFLLAAPALQAQLTLTTALDGADLVWTSSGASFWTPQTTTTHDGVDAAISGGITHNQETSLRTTVTGPGTLTFWWRVSSEADYDWLRFFVDDVMQVQISGESGWQERSYSLAAGVHQLRWQYVKDPFDTLGQDRGWVDEVSFVPSAGAPVIVSQPASQTVWPGANVQLSVVALGEAPLMHQWYRGEEEVPGGTGPTLTLAGVTEAEAGSYRVVVSNATSSVTSVGAVLTLGANTPPTRVLLYWEGFVASAFEVALNNLGIAYQEFYNDEFSFAQAVNSSDRANTLVIVDSTETLNAFSSLVSHVNGGGRAIATVYSLGAHTSLAAAFKVAIAWRLSSPAPVHDWGGSPLFAGMGSLFNLAELGFIEDGQKLHVLPGAVAVGGCTANPAFGEAALVIGHSGRTILNSFFLQNATSGEAAVRLAENEILFLTSQVSATTPLIKVQPGDQRLVPGGRASLSVVAWGGEPLSYQWSRDGVPLDGATGETYDIANAQEEHAGVYRVEVSNEHGMVTSAPANVTVAPSAPVARILTFLEEPGSSPYPNAIGVLQQTYPLTVHNLSDEADFTVAVGQANPRDTLVIVEAALALHIFHTLPSFIDAGGRAIFQFWGLRGGTSLAASFQASVLGSFTLPMPVYDWESGGSLFTSLTSPLNLVELHGANGHRLQPTGGARGLAGFTPTPTVNQTALVLGNSGRTLLHGFVPNEISPSPSAFQFALNELEFFLASTPPAITMQPQNQAVFAGQAASFMVVAAGGPPLTYQWRKDAVDLPGETGTSYAIASAQSGHVGGYTVVVSNPYGSVTSEVARLELAIAPAFVQVPISQSVVQGGSITVSAEIIGHPPPFGYEWRRVSAPQLTLASNTVASTTDFHTFHNVQPGDSGRYRLVVRHPFAGPGIVTFFNLAVLADTDQDGLPDEWELALFQDATAAEAGVDSDGDGQTNAEEYEAGTDPTDPEDVLKFTEIRLGPPLALEFRAVSNKTYSVLYKDEPTNPAWSRLVDLVAEADHHTETVIDSADQPQRLYLLVTPKQPSP